MNVEVMLHWHDGDPAFEVTTMEGRLVIRADPRLSDGQVQRACEQLGEWGPRAHAAWQRVVGLTDSQPWAT